MSATSKALAKVILITKDEVHLIEDFLIFYGTLFGYDNVVVIDNGSTEPVVLDVYDKFAAKGVRIKVDRSPFPDAARFMSDHMRELRESCEWLLPLETDEFMFRIDPTDGEDIRTTVHRYLEALPSDVFVVRYGRFLGSCVDPKAESYVDGAHARPPRTMTRFYDQNWDKIMIRARAFTHMTQWCHHAAVVAGGRKITSDVVGLVHFHETGFRRQIESAVRVMDSFGYVDRTCSPRVQLRQTTRLCRLGVSCGHKVEYYDAFLRRRIAIDTYRRKHGRLPSEGTFASILYHETPRAHAFEIHDVVDFFAGKAWSDAFADARLPVSYLRGKQRALCVSKARGTRSILSQSDDTRWVSSDELSITKPTLFDLVVDASGRSPEHRAATLVRVMPFLDPTAAVFVATEIVEAGTDIDALCLVMEQLWLEAHGTAGKASYFRDRRILVVTDRFSVATN